MGESKHRAQSIGKCIYCSSTDELTREHIIPYGLGGDLVLRDASCKACSDITSKLELRLLRGHWWSYRLHLGMPSRRANEQIPDLPVKVKSKDGAVFEAFIPMNEQYAALIVDFDPPSFLSGIIHSDIPAAARIGIKLLAPTPSKIRVNNSDYSIKHDEQIEIPVNFDAADLCRFLAKIAHGYAIYRRGVNACSEYFLTPLILGKIEGATMYVGGNSSQFVGPLLPGKQTYSLTDRINNGFVTVYIQLFRDNGQPPPIYEVVVGRI